MARQSLEPTRDPADYSFTHRLRTRFAETDAMGIIHHAAYLPYLEEARVEYLRAIGHPYDAVRGGEAGDAREFPVLEVSVQYRQPLHFDDEVAVSLRSAPSGAPRSRSPTCWRWERGPGDRGDRPRVCRRTGPPGAPAGMGSSQSAGVRNGG